MNQLIPINPRTINNQAIQTVSARDLHAFLGVGKDFSTWIKDRIEQFGFSEGADFVKFPEIGESTSKMKMEYALTIDMAKELSMVERNAKGKEARQYFIDCERIAKQVTPLDPKVQLANAVLIAHQVIQEQTLLIETQAQKIEEDAPKVHFYDEVIASDAEFSFAEVSGFIGCLEEELTMCCRDQMWIQSGYKKRIATFKAKSEGLMKPKMGKEGGVAMFTAKGVERMLNGIEHLKETAPAAYDKMFGTAKAYGRKYQNDKKRKMAAFTEYVANVRKTN